MPSSSPNRRSRSKSSLARLCSLLPTPFLKNMISCQKDSLLFIGIVTRIFFSGVYMCYMKKRRDYVVRFLARQQEMSYHTFYFFFSLAPSLLTQHSSKQQLCVDVKTYRVNYLSTERGARNSTPCSAATLIGQTDMMDRLDWSLRGGSNERPSGRTDPVGADAPWVGLDPAGQLGRLQTLWRRWSCSSCPRKPRNNQAPRIFNKTISMRFLVWYTGTNNKHM